MKIFNNPNLYDFQEASRAVENNDGYCPCELTKTADTKCMCKAFREQTSSGFCHCRRFYKVEKLPIITLCGSTRFKDEFFKKLKYFTLQGYIVLLPGAFGHAGDDEVYEANNKAKLDEMHRTKIEMSDAIYIINKNGYIGESTQKEIEWALSLGKQVIYMEENK